MSAASPAPRTPPAQARATEVVPGFDRDSWQALPVRSALQSAAWLDVMTSRLPGAVHTIVHGGEVGFVGTVVDDAGAYEAFNPWTILFREEPVFEAEGVEQRRAPLPGADPASILPSLVLVTPGYVGDPAGRAPSDEATLRDCLSAVAGWCRSQGIRSLCCLYTRHATEALSRVVGGLGGISFPLTARWELPVWWDTWDEYLAGFGSSRRTKVRRELRAAAAAGVTPGRFDPAEHLEALVDGRCARLETYGHAPDRDAERARLQGVLATFAGRVAGFGALRGNELVGAVLCVTHDRVLHVLYAGTTPQGTRLPFTHFVASYYALAQHTGRRDTDRVDYGIGHGTAKALRGCVPEVLHGHAIGLDDQAARSLDAGGRRLHESWRPPPARWGVDSPPPAVGFDTPPRAARGAPNPHRDGQAAAP